MYKAKLWDEDKWDIHSGSYGASKHGNAFASPNDPKGSRYREQKYAGDKASSEYMKSDEEKQAEDRAEEKKDLSDLEEEAKEQKAEEDSVEFKAAKMLFEEHKTERQKSGKGSATIDDAIRKAIEDEKKVIVMG